MYYAKLILVATLPLVWSFPGRASESVAPTTNSAVAVPKEWSDRKAQGEALNNAGRYAEAISVFQQALAIAEQSNPAGFEVIQTLDDLASAYADAGRTLEAERHYQRSLTLVEKLEGRDSLDYAVLLASMACVSRGGGASEELLATLKRATVAYARKGPQNKLTVVQNCLAQLLMNQRRYAEAEPLLLDASVRVQSLGPLQSSSTLNNLGVIRNFQKRYSESASLFTEALKICETTFGPEHPLVVQPLSNLATAFVHLGRFEEAGHLYERAVEICRKMFAQDDKDYAIILANYAVVLKKLGRKREAKVLLAQSEEIQRSSDRRNGVGQTVEVRSFRAN